MKNRYRAAPVAIVGLCLVFGVGTPALPQTQSPNPGAVQKGAVVTTHAKGTFEVKLSPQEAYAGNEGLGRMSIDKQFHGELEGTSKGEMLTGMSSVQGSGVYVAIERVSGTLHGRTGTFILHHTGIMTRGAPSLTVTVAPDSGTGQLAGLTGKMMIDITDGKHSYDFEYTLADTP